jgi:hypothetical protein
MVCARLAEQELATGSKIRDASARSRGPSAAGPTMARAAVPP